MFKPRHLKDSVHFRKGVEKFVHFKKHLIATEKLAAIRKGLDELRLLEATRPDRDTLKKAQDELEALCRGSVPASHAKPVGWLPENVDVFFTAIIVALGIRAYFLQPFKIPTGSMQPTLNGVISESFSPSQTFPSLPVQAWQWIFNSRSHDDIRAASDDAIVKVTERNLLVFFTRATIHMRSGETHSVSSTKAALMQGAGWPQFNGELSGPIPVSKGDIIFRGSSQGGDHLLVDKMSYHFRKPKRGEVFVFSTKGIKDIESGGSFRPEFGSQNYIKRLCAVPGDTLEITADHQLLINGERAREPGFQRVMSMQDGYNGYLIPPPPYPSVTKFDLRPGHFETMLGRFWRNDVRVPQPIYWAMGDNQQSSSDSRFWGPVPQVNLVGPALIVYWPFGNHFGLIK
ncbi:MAG: signal peptidase I [Verrucomicrobiales bacterium]